MINRMSATNEEVSFAEAFCSDYEALLDQCQLALSAWSDRSESARLAHLTGEAIGRELLRLQAHFAKSYAALQKHVHSCERCVAISQLNQLQLDRIHQHHVLPVC